MAALLGWQQKWSTSLSWSSAWSDGFSIGSLTVAPAGRMTVAQTGFGYGIRKDIGDLTLAAGGRATLNGNPANVLPENVNLGNVQIAARGAMTTATGGFNTVDPLWFDPPFIFSAVGHLGFTGTINIAKVLAHPLGAVTLQIGGRSTLAQSGHSYRIRKDLGALTLNMVGGNDLTADITYRDGGPFALSVTSFDLYGRSTISTGNLSASLPPHQIGPATMDMTGRSTTAVVTLFSGGPFALSAAILPIRGRSGVRADISYPGFDEEREAFAALDPTVAPIHAFVEPEGMTVQ